MGTDRCSDHDHAAPPNQGCRKNGSRSLKHLKITDLFLRTYKGLWQKETMDEERVVVRNGEGGVEELW